MAGEMRTTGGTQQCYAGQMEVPLTPEQETFLRRAVETGRYSTPEDAINDALAQWIADERNRAELLATLEEGRADLREDRFTEYTDETLPLLAEELKREARAYRDSKHQ